MRDTRKPRGASHSPIRPGRQHHTRLTLASTSMFHYSDVETPSLLARCHLLSIVTYRLLHYYVSYLYTAFKYLLKLCLYPHSLRIYHQVNAVISTMPQWAKDVPFRWGESREGWKTKWRQSCFCGKGRTALWRRT